MLGLENYSDEELVAQFQAGHEEVIDFIMEKYKGIVKSKARAMYLIGGETEDLIQEGMIGLFKAIRDYSPNREAAFYSFAKLCITRQIYTAVNASNRKKHKPLNTYISLYSGIVDDNESSVPLQDILMSITEKDPEELIIDQERVESIEKMINNRLSNFEKEVLELFLAGKGYMEISEILNKPAKSIDNALQRIRQKIYQSLE